MSILGEKRGKRNRDAPKRVKFFGPTTFTQLSFLTRLIPNIVVKSSTSPRSLRAPQTPPKDPKQNSDGQYEGLNNAPKHPDESRDPPNNLPVGNVSY